MVDAAFDGWAYQSQHGYWRWSLDKECSGWTRAEAIHAAKQWHGTGRVCRVKHGWPAGELPINAITLLEMIDEDWHGLNPEAIVPEDAPILACTEDDIADLNHRLSEAWFGWLSERDITCNITSLVDAPEDYK